MTALNRNKPFRWATFMASWHGLLTAWLLLMAFIAQAAAAPLPFTTKISPVILAHRAAKQQPVSLSAAVHRQDLMARGLNADNLSSEACALYANSPLSPAESAQLALQGIRVTPDLWIPPVAGRHAQGFHLATVDYESLDVIQNDARFTRLESTEFMNRPLNDLAINMIKASSVHTGTGVSPYNGAGVRIAVADSGLDLSHDDFPTPFETFDMTTGDSPASWSTTVANTVTPHGTHVTGSALGRGTLSSNKYRGSAPGADLCFYKIGDDATGDASEDDIIEAINRAITVNADVFTLSYGGVSTYMDGSEAAEQAIDAAVAAGVTVFVAAGNQADDERHASVNVPPATTSASFGFTITNTTGSRYRGLETIRIIWRDNAPGDFNLTLTCTNLSTSGSYPSHELLTWESSSTSARGTESLSYNLKPNLAKRITNSPLAVGTATQRVCLAGALLSNAYTLVSTTNVTLTLTNNATLTWTWQTQYRLTALTNGSGNVTGTISWMASGASASLTAVADSYWTFTGWSGDTGECTIAGNVLTAEMTRARAITAHFAANLAPEGTPEYWLAAHGLTNASFATEEGLDRDGDGMPAWKEYVADTNPTNSTSVLLFTSIRREGSTVRLNWKGGQWARQYLEERTNLANAVPDWNCVLTNGVLPTSITNSTLRPDAIGPNRFYRIRVER